MLDTGEIVDDLDEFEEVHAPRGRHISSVLTLSSLSTRYTAICMQDICSRVPSLSAF